MKNQIHPLLAAVLLSSAASLGLSSQSFGADVADETEEPQAEEFFLHGYIEMGGLIFIDRPPVEERSSFEKYGEVSPGFIVPEVALEYGNTDGLNLLEFRGTDLTWNNRNAVVEFSRAGQLYVSGEWDESPNLARSRAWTLFGGAGSDTLTVPDGVQSALQAAQFGLNDGALPSGTPGSTTTANIAAIIEPNLHPTRLEVDRKTGQVSLRYTPTPQWGINLNYSIEKRDGTKVEGSTIGMKHARIRNNTGMEEGIVELIAPVDYTTQNFGASIQYLADLGNGRKWVTNLAYAGSVFDNANDSLTYENPFRLDNSLSPYASNVGGILVGEDGSNLGRHSLEPDNSAHAITLNTALDLGDKTRFTGTVSYNMMRQDEDLLPWTINADLYALNTLALPATRANAAIDTLTVDTKLTTRALHPDVTTTARYRYYSVDNDTPQLYFPERIAFDSEFIECDPLALPEPECQSYRVPAAGYVKQNAGLDTVWRAHDMATLGLLFGWEQYDRDIGREADITNEYSAKVTADLMPVDWLSVRASALYAERRFNEYDYLNRVDRPANENGDEEQSGPQNHELIRKFSMSDRDRTEINASVGIDPVDGLTFTGLGGWRNNEYGDHLAFDSVPNDSEIGLLYDRSWHAGLEIDYMAAEGIGIYGSYVHEDFDRKIRNRGYDANPAPGAANFDWVDAQITELVDTFMAGVNVALFDDRADLNLGYTYARGVEEWTDGSFAGFADSFPDVTTTFQRFDASLKFNVPEDKLNGTRLAKAFAKIAYAYERNRVTNWADNVTPYAPAIGSTALWLAGKDPNYEAQIVTITGGIAW